MTVIHCNGTNDGTYNDQEHCKVLTTTWTKSKYFSITYGKRGLLWIKTGPTPAVTVDGSFSVSSATVTIGDKYYLRGSASVENSTLKTVTVNTLYYDKSDYPYSEVSRSFSSGTSISLESYSSTYVLDTSKAPFNTAGTYTLNLWVKAADGTADKVDTMTLKTVGGEASLSVQLDTTSTVAGSNIAFWPVASFSTNATELKFQLLNSSGTAMPFIRAYYYNQGVSTTETSFSYTIASDASELASGSLSLGMYIPSGTAAGSYKIKVTVTAGGSTKSVTKDVTITSGTQTYDPALPIPTLSGTSANKLLQVAASQIGYKEKDDNQTVYGAYTGTNGSPWCAPFVSWCAYQAGLSSIFKVNGTYANPYDLLKSGYEVWYFEEFPNWTSSSSAPRKGFSYFMSTASSTTYDPNRSIVVPQKGDLIFFSNNGAPWAHVGMVESYDASSKNITYIDGNGGSTNKVRRTSLYLTSATELIAIARPNY